MASQNAQKVKLERRMLQRGAGRFSMVLKEQDVFEAPVFFEIENAVPERPQNVLDSFCRKRGQRRVVVGRFNDHFVRANAIHLVKHALSLLAQAAWKSENI